jgi:hypothetical protein
LPLGLLQTFANEERFSGKKTQAFIAKAIKSETMIGFQDDLTKCLDNLKSIEDKVKNQGLQSDLIAARRELARELLATTDHVREKLTAVVGAGAAGKVVDAMKAQLQGYLDWASEQSSQATLRSELIVSRSLGDPIPRPSLRKPHPYSVPCAALSAAPADPPPGTRR